MLQRRRQQQQRQLNNQLFVVIIILIFLITNIKSIQEQNFNDNNNNDNDFYVVQLPSTASGIQIPSYSHGFSLEMSHWTNVFSTRTNNKQSTGFLQLLGNIQDRRGSLMLRLGGNSQDAAISDESINSPIAKTGEQATRTNSGATTFNIKVHSQIFDAMRQISHIVPMKWMIGLNFEDANNTESAQILGKLAVDSLLDDDLLYSIQIGNEPDLYAKHGVRKTEWGIEDYTNEWMAWATQLSHHYFDDNDKTPSLKSTTSKRRNIFTGGVICCTWQLQDLLDSGYFERSKDLINSITVQKYSSNACFGVAKGDISDFTSHSWITSLPRTMYEEPAKIVIENNKELIMGETNSAACRGIQGISDTYVSALWSIDWQLFLYSIGFSSVELQLGGSTSHYNPMSKVGGSWIVNPIYYGSLVTAEALGPSDAEPQVVHIDVSSDSRAAYAVFHQQALKYIVLINLNPDEEAVFSLQSSFTGSWWNNDENGDENNILKVKRLTADSLQEKHVIQWAGQTLHGVSDGLLRGDIEIDQVKCNDPNQCEITLPKGSVALVGRDFDEYHTTIIADHTFDVDDFLGVNNSYNHDNSYNFTNPLRMAGTTTSATATCVLLPSTTSLFISISLVIYYMFIVI